MTQQIKGGATALPHHGLVLCAWEVHCHITWGVLSGLIPVLAEAPSPTPPPQPEQGQSFSDIDVRAQKHGCNDISRVLSAVWPAASAAWRVRRGALSLWLSARTLRSAVHGG